MRLPGMSHDRSASVTLLGLLRSTLTQNAKYLAVGIGAFALAGGTATTVSLASSGTPSPKSSHAPAKAQDATTDAADTADEAETAEPAEPAETGDTGVRPTDTHGYCVSHAVAAAKAAHKTGRDIAAAAHSCPKPGHSADKGKAGEHGKAGQHGKSSAAPGRTNTP